MSCNWSNSELKYLSDNCETMPLSVISEKLNKEYYCILNQYKKITTRNNINYVKDGWYKIKNYTKSLDILPYEEVKEFLLNNHTKYVGRSGNRVLIKENPKIFNSLYFYTKELDDVSDKNSRSFMAKIIYIIKHDCSMDSIKCECGGNVSFKQKHSPYKEYKYNFQPFCVKCQPKYPSERYFKFKYGQEWEKHVNERREKLSKLKTNSKEWFIDKYGEEWINYYLPFYGYKMTTLHNNNGTLNKNSYSKISQELFHSISNKVTTKEKIYYATNNGEYFINLSDDNKIKLNKHCIKPDFKVGKKIIEFNGSYWHSKTVEEDDLRYKLLNEMGYDVMVVSENEYKSNKDIIINKCVNFINE